MFSSITTSEMPTKEWWWRPSRKVKRFSFPDRAYQTRLKIENAFLDCKGPLLAPEEPWRASLIISSRRMSSYLWGVLASPQRYSSSLLRCSSSSIVSPWKQCALSVNLLPPQLSPVRTCKIVEWTLQNHDHPHQDVFCTCPTYTWDLHQPLLPIMPTLSPSLLYTLSFYYLGALVDFANNLKPQRDCLYGMLERITKSTIEVNVSLQEHNWQAFQSSFCLFSRSSFLSLVD